MTKNKTKWWILIRRDSKIFKKFRSHLKIVAVRRVAPSKLHTEYPQMLGRNAQKFIARAKWWPLMCAALPMNTATKFRGM